MNKSECIIKLAFELYGYLPQFDDWKISAEIFTRYSNNGKIVERCSDYIKEALVGDEDRLVIVGNNDDMIILYNPNEIEKSIVDIINFYNEQTQYSYLDCIKLDKNKTCKHGDINLFNNDPNIKSIEFEDASDGDRVILIPINYWQEITNFLDNIQAMYFEITSDS
jgi:hypothetical protein